VIPKYNSDTGTGWFNVTNTSNVSVETLNTFNYPYMGYDISCEPAYGALCGSFVGEMVDQNNDCAYVVFCLTTVDSLPYGYNGIVGMGKWQPKDSDSNYLMQMYIQNTLEPILTFDLNFYELPQTSTITKDKLFSNSLTQQNAEYDDDGVVVTIL